MSKIANKLGSKHFIELEDKKETQITILDLSGKVLFETRAINGYVEIQPNLKPGTYILKCESDSSSNCLLYTSPSPRDS